MKKIFGISLVVCLMLALLCGAALAEKTSPAAVKKMEQGSAKTPDFPSWLYGVRNLKLIPNGLTAKLTWSPDSSGNADGYAIYQCLRSSTKPSGTPFGWYTGPRNDGYYWYPVKLLGTISGTSFTVKAPSAGTYYIEVDSYSVSTSYYVSPRGEFATFTATKSGVSAPKTVTVKQTGSNKVKLTWTKGENAKSYAIYRKDGSGSFKKIGTTTKLSYIDKKVKNGKKYQYKIQAINGSKTAYSSVVKAYPMAKPSSVKAKGDGNGNVTVSWKKVKGAKKYLVFQKSPGSSSFSQAASVKTTKAKIAVSSGDGSYKYYVVPVVGTFEGLKSAKVSVNVTGTPAADVVYRALLIGQTYVNSNSTTLTACEYDRQAMENTLKNLTSTKYSGNIYSVKDASSSEILSAIDKVFSQADADDVTLLYYSGHGVNDYGDSYQGALVGDDGTYITASKLRAALDKYRGKKVILLDSCFSGYMIGKDLDRSAQKTMARKINASFLQAFYSPVQKGSDDLAASGYYVITASTGEQTSSASNYWSVFTRALVGGLGWDEYNDSLIESLYADSDKDDKVTLAECYKYTKAGVDELENYLNTNYNWDVEMDVQVYPTGCTTVFFGR